MNTLSRITLVTLAAVSLGACDFLDQDPQANLSNEIIFTNRQGVEAAIAGAYDRTQDPMDDYVVFSDLAADYADFSGSFPSWQEVDTHNLQTTNAEARDQYTDWYQLVYQANLIIDNVGSEPIEGLSAARATEVVGEAYFFRAYAFHNLSKWFGPIALPLSSDIDVTETSIARSSLPEVYTQILSDLDNAASRVAAARPVGFVDADVVQALRARVLLFDSQYDAAAAAAAPLAAKYPLVTLTDLYGSLNSAESIWELQYNNTDPNSMAFFAFVTGGRREYAPSTAAVNAYGANDGRLAVNIKTDGPATAQQRVIGKYFRVANGDDHHFIFRGAEMVLIQAEAAARNGNVAEAVRLVNQIRTRAGATPIDASTIASGGAALDLVLEERARELAYEGHRWHDLVRTGRAVATLPSLTSENFTRWPIPQREMDANDALEQNPGY